LSIVAAEILVSAGFGVAFARAAPQELKKLHALLVIDTNSSLKDSIVVDKARMEALLVNGIPKDRYDLKTLTGNEVTRQRILNYFQQMRAGGSDAILFYYAGHGAIDPQRGHFFYLQEGKTAPLIRSDLRRAMTQTQAGLSVILTDCCSNHLKIPKKRSFPLIQAPAREIQPMVRCLLFQSRGVVDITAASDNSAWGDEQDGGIFTRSLARLMQGDVSTLDADGDGFVSWKEFFSGLDRQTATTFVDWARQAKARGDAVDQSSQRPHAFQIPGVAPPTNASGREASYAVVGLRNDTSAAVHYQYRWSTEESWQNGTIGAQSTAPHVFPLSNQVREMPLLEIRFGSAEKAARLQAKHWTGSGSPTYESGAKYKVASKRKLRSFEVQTPADEAGEPSDETAPSGQEGRESAPGNMKD
jgi:hypothetical protein